ncbi:hypothetical protein NQZ79_g5843 [Umbelopsis isabellina]|nr:hypothetical protein NQZ79_g5843 [Umbelopsis isabellina]
MAFPHPRPKPKFSLFAADPPEPRISFRKRIKAYGRTIPGITVTSFALGMSGGVLVAAMFKHFCSTSGKTMTIQLTNQLGDMRHQLENGGGVPYVLQDEDGEKVKQFVNSQGSSMDYIVAIDRKGAANRAFMVPTNTKGIPAAFILERNKLIHNSHPMDPAFTNVLQAAVARSAASPPKALPLVTASRDELMQKPNKELRQILKERGISDKDCLEKSDFVDKIIKTCSQVQYYASS